MKNIKKTIIIIVIFIFIFIFAAYLAYFYKEAFENAVSKNKNIILLGDSIFKNNAYVPYGLSIESQLENNAQGQEVLCLAQDNSSITDVCEQVEEIPEDYNNRRTHIFLSVGGNDILQNYVYKYNDYDNMEILKACFTEYKKLIKTIQGIMPEANLTILDIYYPNKSRFKSFYHVISEWNKLIYDYAKRNNIRVIKISNILTNADDFSFAIEPSAIGGNKIVNELLINC
jgi:hypothetical protein